MKPVPIPFPFGGVSENFAFSQQEPGTTRSAENVRGIDPVTGRTRGAQRAGLSKFNDNLLSGSNKIAAMARAVKDEARVSWAETTSGVGADAVQVAGIGQGQTTAQASAIVRDDFGSIYILDTKSGVRKVNADGFDLATITPPVDLVANDLRLRSIAVDLVGNVFIGAGDPTEYGSPTSTATIQDKSRIWAFSIQFDGSYEFSWEIDTSLGVGTGGSTNARYVEALAVNGQDLYAVLYDKEGGGTQDRVHIYRDYDIDSSDPPEVNTAYDYVLATTRRAPRAIAVRPDDGSFYICGDDYDATPTSDEQWLAKYSLDSTTELWALEGFNDSKGGVGMGVALGELTDDGQYVYSVGIQQSADLFDVRRVIDRGSSVVSDGTLGTWAVAAGTSFPAVSTDINANDEAPLGLAVDGDYYLYVPWSGGASALQPCVLVFDDSDGSGLFSYDMGSPDIHPTAVALPAGKPDYGGAAVDPVEYVYTAHEFATASNYIAHFIRTATASPDAGGFRTHVTLGVSDGDIVKFPSGSGAVTVVGNGSLDSTARYVCAASLFQKVYFTDGITYQVYDSADDSVARWTSETEGSIPPRCKLLTQWRGRMVLARDAEDPQNWHMSAVAEPNNWNSFPQVATITQAISGNLARAGRTPDIVNTLIPYSDDLLIFGGDRSIWRLTGDPMDGGQLDFVTDETGIAFGQGSWTKDPDGNLYFFGSRGGVYAWVPGARVPVRMTRDRIERDLQAVDLSTFYIELAWNYEDEGLHVFQVPYGAGGTLVNHWFWDQKSDAWWPDKMGATDVQPTSVLVVDGDTADDRLLLIGCEDGYVRKWDTAAVNDDDNRIHSRVAIGPITDGSAGGHEFGFGSFTVVLARDQQGCRYNLYRNDEPDEALDEPAETGALSAGRNPTRLVRFSGDSAYVEFSNPAAGERWALEEATIEVERMSMKRVRA